MSSGLRDQNPSWIIQVLTLTWEAAGCPWVFTKFCNDQILRPGQRIITGAWIPAAHNPIMPWKPPLLLTVPFGNPVSHPGD